MSSIIIDKIHSKVKIDNPTHVIDLPHQVMLVEFSPYEWSHNLICIAFPDRVATAVVKFQEEEDDELDDDIDFDTLQEFNLQSRVHALAWSPETSLNVIPKKLEFCAATADFNIVLFSSNTNDAYTEQVLRGHTSYVNAVAYEPLGSLLVSTGDDLTCRLWALKGEKPKENYCCTAVFHLQSPGMSACWHNDEPGKLLVGEQNGTVRMYSAERQQAILSFDADIGLLVAADWAPSNSLRVAALVGGSLVVWDTLRPSCPVEVRPVHADSGRWLRYSQLSEHHIATLGQPDNMLKVTHVSLKHPVTTATLKLAGGLTWHYRLPYVCVGQDQSLCFWKVTTK